jgi:hypothetical protein
MKRLLAIYATRQTQSAKSHMGENRGGTSGSCILTIGIIVGHTPAAYRRRGESILQRWCDMRAAESEVEHAEAAARGRDRFDPRITEFDHQRRIIVEHYAGIERDPVFKGALCWAAADLERRLAVVPNREALLWLELLGG